MVKRVTLEHKAPHRNRACSVCPAAILVSYFERDKTLHKLEYSNKTETEVK